MMANGFVKFTGEPGAGKLACPVRGRVVGKVPQGNSLAIYPTAIEFDGDDTFFGWVDGDFPELGYFRLSELQVNRGKFGLPIERDRCFKPCRLSELQAALKR